MEFFFIPLQYHQGSNPGAVWHIVLGENKQEVLGRTGHQVSFEETRTA
jgi:hypothetical protein